MDILFSYLKESFIAWRKVKATQIAAALSFYSIFSLIPLFIVMTSILNFTMGNTLTHQDPLQLLSTYIGVNNVQQIEKVMTNVLAYSPKNVLFMVIGIMILLLSALEFFVQIQNGLNQIWGVKTRSGLGVIRILRDRFFSFLIVMIVTYLIMLSIFINTVVGILLNFSIIPIPSFVRFILLNYVLSYLFLVIVFAALFKILPDVSNKWNDVWIGAILTATLFTLGRFLLELYISESRFLTAYGASTSLIIILLWVYYSAQILFFGAIFTKITSDKRGTKITPTKNAVFIHSHK